MLNVCKVERENTKLLSISTAFVRHLCRLTNMFYLHYVPLQISRLVQVQIALLAYGDRELDVQNKISVHLQQLLCRPQRLKTLFSLPLALAHFLMFLKEERIGRLSGERKETSPPSSSLILFDFDDVNEGKVDANMPMTIAIG